LTKGSGIFDEGGKGKTSIGDKSWFLARKLIREKKKERFLVEKGSRPIGERDE